MKRGWIVKTAVVMVALGACVALPKLNFGAEEKEKEGAGTKTIKGEIVDLMCYLDHGAKGAGHKACAEKCINSGGPVGLLSGDEVYLVVGDHAPLNKELASMAAETVTLKGKVVGRHGMRMIENAEVVK